MNAENNKSVDATPRFSSEILDHYNLGTEATRLEQSFSWLERLRTNDLLRRFLPPSPARIADVGGAAGVYALPLAKRGYSVHLLDPVPLHIAQARAASLEQSKVGDAPLASADVGDARELPYEDESVDAVLLLGPLYHLVEHNDRIQALREALRVLRPGGIAFAVGISSFASLMDGFSRGRIKDETFYELVQEDLSTGQHRNPTGNPQYFTTAFLHHPDRLKLEMKEAGFRFEILVGIEGPVWALPDFDYWLTPEAKKEKILGLLQQIEQEPSLIGASAHIMGIGKK